MRSISRRDFIVASGAAAAAGVLAGCGGGGGMFVEPGPQGKVGNLSRQHFEALVGLPFLLEDPAGHPTWLDLEAVVDNSDVAAYPSEMSFRDPFALIFRGEKDVVLEEGSYALMHPEFDVFDLHIIPRMPSNDGSRYDIIFS